MPDPTPSIEGRTRQWCTSSSQLPAWAALLFAAPPQAEWVAADRIEGPAQAQAHVVAVQEVLAQDHVVAVQEVLAQDHVAGVEAAAALQMASWTTR
jgi:hypothetical protein